MKTITSLFKGREVRGRSKSRSESAWLKMLFACAIAVILAAQLSAAADSWATAALVGTDLVTVKSDSIVTTVVATDLATRIDRVVWTGNRAGIEALSGAGNTLALVVDNGDYQLSADDVALQTQGFRVFARQYELVSVDLHSLQSIVLKTAVHRSYSKAKKVENCGEVFRTPLVTPNGAILAATEDTSFDGMKSLKRCGPTRRSVLKLDEFPPAGTTPRRVATIRSIDDTFDSRKGAIEDVLPDVKISTDGRAFVQTRRSIDELKHGRLKRIYAPGPKATIKALSLGPGGAVVEVVYIGKPVTNGSNAQSRITSFLYFSRLGVRRPAVLARSPGKLGDIHAVGFCRPNLFALWHRTPSGKGRRLSSVRFVRLNGHVAQSLPIMTGASDNDVLCNEHSAVVINDFDSAQPPFAAFDLPQ